MSTDYVEVFIPYYKPIGGRSLLSLDAFKIGRTDLDERLELRRIV